MTELKMIKISEIQEPKRIPNVKSTIQTQMLKLLRYGQVLPVKAKETKDGKYKIVLGWHIYYAIKTLDWCYIIARVEK